MYDGYKDFFQTMLTYDFVELVPDNVMCGLPGKLWYLARYGFLHNQEN